MAIEKFSKDMAIIAALDDEPNDVGDMTAAELKDKFDEGGEALKKYLNEKLLPALENLGVEHMALLPENAAGFKYIRLNSDKVLEVSTDGTNWQATGSSGHLILDKDGKQLPQRSRLKFANSVVTDDGTNTVVQGVKGDKGDTGATGAQGPQGVQGVKGERGQVFVPSVNDDGVLSWTVQEPTTTVPASRNIRGPQGIQGVQGIQGKQGATGATGAQGAQGPRGETGPAGKDGVDGRSFVIKGMYATLAALMAAHPTGSAGDAYAVGTAKSNTVYNWDAEKELWENLGPLRGPQGEQGIQGAQGIQGPQGEQGVQGEQGAQGPQGQQGIQGPEGPQGPRGYPANVNGKTPDDSGAITLTAADVGAPTTEEMRQSLKNAVLTTAQTLTAAEQAQARGNIAAAPSGYGFGGEAIPTIAAASANEPYDTFCARVDGVLNTMTDGSVKLVRAYPPQLRGYGHDVCVLYKAGANYVGLRTLSGYNNQFYGFCMMKYKTYDSDPAGAWRPLEWVNPPLATGVEYRTTERYLGKPVYKKLVVVDSVPPGRTKVQITEDDSASCFVISVYAYSNSNVQYMSPIVVYVSGARAMSTGVEVALQNTTSSTFAHYYILVSYTKK